MTLLNIFNSGGLWVLPLIVFGAATYLMILAHRMSKSGSVTGGSYSDPVKKPSDINVPIYKTWAFAWSVGLYIVGIGMLILIAQDYKGV